LIQGFPDRDFFVIDQAAEALPAAGASALSPVVAQWILQVMATGTGTPQPVAAAS
jgi:hypothetical protein